MLEQRKALRESGDYEAADKLHTELKGMGVKLQDVQGSWAAAGKPRKKRKLDGPCFAFQQGGCERGEACLFAHVSS